MTDERPDHAEVIGPPPLLYTAALVIGAGLEWFWPTAIGLGWLPLVLGAILILAGLAIALLGALALRRAGTAIPPNLPTTELVTDGPFRWSRNPLYLALTLIYAGIGLIADDLWILMLGRRRPRGALSRGQVRRGLPPVQGGGAPLALERDSVKPNRFFCHRRD